MILCELLGQVIVFLFREELIVQRPAQNILIGGILLRKDFPLGYEEPQFTFNFDEIGSLKPYAKE